jgi:hypothetical protein
MLPAGMSASTVKARAASHEATIIKTATTGLIILSPLFLAV